ncbi:MAG: lysine--tRNA ligase [Planctomycetaceae bacterium]|nr:lysine--tRNA ligase [Planctomycetaceae bacterium]
MSNEEKSTAKESTSSGVVLEAARREKLRKIEELGFDPWGQRFDNHTAIQTIRDRENEIVRIEPTQQEIDEAAANNRRPPQARSTGPKVRAAGRIILQRKKGKLIFLDIWDWTGKIQVLIGAGQVGEKKWELAQCFDLGDIIGVDGELMQTHTGELSIAAADVTFLSKSIKTPPDKFHGITDPELRSRRRYLDLIHTDGVLERMLKRTKIVHSIRQTLADEDYVEVEGPTLHTIAGGAAARPFATHHNALDIPLVLRIALELHLKRLLVGGMERVYELGRVYRNEGIDQRHNPEFTMLELYQAYGNYETMMELTEKIIRNAVKAIGSSDNLFTQQERFARKKYDDLIREYTGVNPEDSAAVIEYAKTLGLDTQGRHPDVIKNEVFEAKIEKNLIKPTFVYDYPASICPLTKRKRDNPNIAERFELFVNGMELANAYTELNDPDLQEQLFSKQLAGQKEEDSMAKMDKDFIRALCYAMPPAGGLGIGIDRLCMLLTETNSIREVILFPLQRPES